MLTKHSSKSLPSSPKHTEAEDYEQWKLSVLESYKATQHEIKATIHRAQRTQDDMKLLVKDCRILTNMWHKDEVFEEEVEEPAKTELLVVPAKKRATAASISTRSSPRASPYRNLKHAPVAPVFSRLYNLAAHKQNLDVKVVAPKAQLDLDSCYRSLSKPTRSTRQARFNF